MTRAGVSPEELAVMRGIKRTVVEALVLGAVGLVVGLTANAVRAKGSLRLTRNYFDKGAGRVVEVPKAIAGKDTLHASNDTTTPGLNPPGAAPNGEAAEAEEQHLDHPYQEVSIEEVVAIFNDPNTEMGLNVFVDARNDETFEEGHVPGAIQVDHYRIEEFIDNILLYEQGAEKLIVYCNGGKCEDSIFVCRDLVDAGVLFDKIYLFAGGWEQWTAENMPVATGRDGEGNDE